MMRARWMTAVALACAVGLVVVGCDGHADRGSSAPAGAGSSSISATPASTPDVATNPDDMPMYAFAGQPIDVTGWYPGASYTVADNTSGQPLVVFMVWPTEGWDGLNAPLTAGIKVGQITVPDGTAEVREITDGAGNPSAAAASWSPAPGYSAVLLLNKDDGSATLSTLRAEADKLIPVTQADMLASLNGEGAKPENRPAGTLPALTFPGHTKVRILSPGAVSISTFDVDSQPADSVGLTTYASGMRNTVANTTGTDVKVRGITGTITSASDRNGNRFTILVWRDNDGVTYSLRYPDSMDDTAATGFADTLRPASAAEWSALLFPTEAVAPLGDTWINWSSGS